MSLILALDTSTEACSVALHSQAGVEERFAILERRHAVELLPMVHALMAEAGIDFAALDAIAFGRGPGSFTGLRIAAGVAQGLAFGADVPVVPVSTLAALALQAARLHDVSGIAALLDARIGEVYWGWFKVDGTRVMPLMEEGLCAPDAVSLPDVRMDWFGAGSGWRFHDRMSSTLQTAVRKFDAALLPRAGDIAILAAEIFRQGGAVPAEDAVPVYLRDKVTHQTPK